jgi:tyrosine-protein kinase Etk/Wzc
VGAYLMLRYTQPIYEAKTIIQIESESKAQKFLELGRITYDQFSQKLELLRSRTFIERVLAKLPLDVRYYNEGKFLNYELYTSSPFYVNYVIYNPVVYNIPFKLTYVNDSLLKLNYSYRSADEEVKRETDIFPGKWMKFEELDLIINLKPNGSHMGNIFPRQKSFLFEIIQTDKLYDYYHSSINLTVLNEVAQTIQISVRDKNPARASDIANEMAAEFQAFDIEKRSQSASNILEYIEFQLQNVFEDMLMYEDSISEYKRAHNVSEIDEMRRQNTLSQLNNFENELVKAQMESNILKSILDELSTKETPDALLLITILSGSQYSTQLQSDIDKLGELVKRKEQMLLQLPPNSSFFQSIDQQIELQKNLMLTKAQNIKNSTDVRIKELTRRYNTQFNQAFSADSKPHFDLKRYERSYSVTESFYNQLIEKQTEFSILIAGYVPENIILEKAYRAGEKVYPSKKKVLMIVIVLASFLSFVIVAFKYFKFDAIVSVSEIGKYSSVPLLGVLPKYASEIPLHKFIVEKYPKSFLAESLRAVRSNLQFISNSPGPKVIAITSTISGEGKTFLSVNLAGVLAISGKKVIIIDSDMRNPTVHKYFNLKNKLGLSSILSEQCNVEDSVQDINKFDIKFITAGPIPPNPAELLNDEKFALLIEKLKSEYDFVIIDNPPIGLVSDALKSMQLADYPIYVLKANFSKRNFLPLTEKMLNVYNIKNLSLILNAYDKSISNVDMEKDLVYAYGYAKGSRKGSKNHYYEQDEQPQYTFIQKLKKVIKNSF